MTRTETRDRPLDLAGSVEGFRFSGPVVLSAVVMGCVNCLFHVFLYESLRSHVKDPSAADWCCELKIRCAGFCCCSPAPFPEH